MLQNTGEEGKKRDEARKIRMAAKERERRLSLAQYRDRLRRRKIADGLPIPDDLKEQEWERLIARGDVRWLVCSVCATCSNTWSSFIPFLFTIWLSLLA